MVKEITDEPILPRGAIQNARRERVEILVVDDEASVRDLIRKILEKHGYQCHTAANAADARDLLKTQEFAVLLCDIRMPGESGLDLIRHVKPAYPDTAIVMVTAIDDPQEAKIVLEAGIYGYIIKPFEASQILISVANALRRRDLEMNQRSNRQELERTVRERTGQLEEANSALRTRESELRKRKEELEEVNSALRVLLKKREEDKAALEESVLANVKKTVEPYLERLKQSRMNDKQREELYILESSIREIISPFVKELSSSYLNLTPTELQVAHLIRQGKSTKEIASILDLSENTVMSHRYRLRNKLGLLKKKTNLHTFLRSFT